MRRRTHPRRRRRFGAVLGVLFVLVFATLAVPAGSFSTASVARGSTFGVVSDADGSHNLNVSQSVTIGQTDPLVTVTNDLGTDVTIELRLRSDSTGKGDLVVGGDTVGDETSFSLPKGTSRTVSLDVPSDAALDGERVYFDVNASAPGLAVTAPNRSTTLTT